MSETAQQLAADLTPHLVALANLHYLMDSHITTPKLRELRLREDKVFEEILQCVRAASHPENLGALKGERGPNPKDVMIGHFAKRLS